MTDILEEGRRLLAELDRRAQERAERRRSHVTVEVPIKGSTSVKSISVPRRAVRPC